MYSEKLLDWRWWICPRLVLAVPFVFTATDRQGPETEWSGQRGKVHGGDFPQCGQDVVALKLLAKRGDRSLAAGKTLGEQTTDSNQ